MWKAGPLWGHWRPLSHKAVVKLADFLKELGVKLGQSHRAVGEILGLESIAKESHGLGSKSSVA